MVTRRRRIRIIRQPGAAGSTQLQRFLFEARAAARLHHTNIVPVFGVGADSGIHYYAMQFIQGQGLDKVLDEGWRMFNTMTGRIVDIVRAE